MSTIAIALAQAATLDLEAGGLHWRIRKVTPGDLENADAAMTLATLLTRRSQAKVTDVSPQRELTERELAEGFRRGLAFETALVCGGVQMIGRDGIHWEPIQVVSDPAKQREAVGVLHIAALPPGAAKILGDAIYSLSTDHGEAAKRIASFLGG